MCQHLQKNFCDTEDERREHQLRSGSLGSSGLSSVLLILLFRAVGLLLHVFVVDVQGFLNLAAKSFIVVHPKVMLAIVI